MAAYYFPSSSYLSEKWWHRLAIVIFWSWVAAAVFLSGACLIMLYEAMQGLYTDQGAIPRISALAIGALASPLVPSVVYRAILFIATNGAWKEGAA